MFSEFFYRSNLFYLTSQQTSLSIHNIKVLSQKRLMSRYNLVILWFCYISFL